MYSAEKALTDHKDAVPADVKSGIEAKITELKAVKDTDNLDEIKNKTSALSTEMQKIGEAMSKAQNQQNPTENKEENTDGNVRDAEIDDTDKNV
jgi:molecular chaperone DnaK